MASSIASVSVTLGETAIGDDGSADRLPPSHAMSSTSFAIFAGNQTFRDESKDGVV